MGGIAHNGYVPAEVRTYILFDIYLFYPYFISLPIAIKIIDVPELGYSASDVPYARYCLSDTIEGTNWVLIFSSLPSNRGELWVLLNGMSTSYYKDESNT